MTRDQDKAREILRRRANAGSYEGDEVAIATALSEAREEALREMADRLDVYSVHHLEIENRFAAHGAYDSAAELVAWKHGVRAAAQFIRDHRTAQPVKP